MHRRVAGAHVGGPAAASDRTRHSVSNITFGKLGSRAEAPGSDRAEAPRPGPHSDPALAPGYPSSSSSPPMRASAASAAGMTSPSLARKGTATLCVLG